MEGVKQAHVKVQCLGRRDVLVGYLVLNDPLLSESDIKMSLKEHLPEYMVPDYVLFLERFPLTPNFKLDEAQLPIPQTSKLQSSIIPVEGHALEFLKLFWTHMGVEIGWKDNFFHQGGNSIAAISIAADVYKKFGLGLPFEQFEKQGTPESIWNAINSHLFELTEIKTYLNDIEEYVDAPLSSSQRSIWFLANMDPFDRAYHAKARLMFHGSVDPEAVIYAIQKTVDRHSIFRTVFLAGNGEGIQRVYRTYDVSLQRFDFSSLDKAKSEQSLDELIQNGLNQPFVLFQLPLVRWALVKLSNDKHVLVHIEHHLVHDGWSYNLFLKDFTYYYRAYVENVFEERSLPAQYVDFCVTQEQWLKTAKTQQQLDYWQKRLDGVTGTLNLPKYVPDIGHAAPGKTLRIPLERSQWNAIEKLAEQRRETPFSIMLAAYYLTLSRFSGDKDVCVGSAFANRQWINADSIIGMMINTVVLRGQLTEDMTTHQLLMQSSKGVLEAQQHQSLPFEYLVTALNPEREPGVNPYFQVFFGFHDSPMPDSELPGISEIQVYEAIDSNAAKFDLSVVVIPREGQLGEGDPVHILWEFKTTKYPQWLIENMIQDYMQILQQISSGYTGCISEIPVQSTPIVGYDVEVTDDTVYQQFRRQAMRMPEHSALTCKGITYSFTMLLHLVEKKAAYLKNLGIVPGQFIGICLQRDANSIAWMLACQANGIGYIPLDPSYPAERINYIISHSQMKYLVAEREEFAAIRINPDAFSDDAWQPSAVDSTWPMYCIYTSGSTGLPKGVVISFAAFNNFIFAMAEQFRLQVGDRWLALTSFSFDISTLELYLPLVSGAEIVLAGQDENADAVALIDYLKNAQITHCQATPSTWRILTDMGWRPLRDQVILSGGEAIDVQLVNALSENGNRCYNMYGPTETTVWSSLKEVSFSDSDLSIGKPIANTQFYILDHNLNPVPHGAIGQLWIGGAGLANGYWDMDEYTKERFIQHPSNKQRIYQTGDLAYIDAQYEVHFCGRIDQQVKISGYRIELEEIEQVIKLLAEVKQVAVVVRDITDTAQLVAFVNAQCKEEDILAHCRAKLPAYMIPHRIVRLETLPLTPNKKVDKKALPTVIAADTIQYKPKTSTEHKLAAIFSHHLQLEQIDTHRHFYKLGGNSLLAMRVCFDIEKELNIHIRGIDLLELGSLSALASFIDSFYLNESDLEYIEEITL
ncbi:amino acid adenylation domain-containing protein [Shewanella sp.]|uniref:amino acid adenylation domain-containing protein n=1 Tax=Shewanella sp. TaxID=50422 RepID=UPI004053CAB2